MASITKTQLIALQKKFKTDQAIGDQFGITRQAIHQLRKKYGIEARTANVPERNEKIAEAFDKGIPVTKLATKFNLSVPQIYRILKDSK